MQIKHEYIITVLFGIIGFFCVYILNDMSNHIDKMTDSVNRLNATMSAVITNQKSYDARIKKLEEKVD